MKEHVKMVLKDMRATRLQSEYLCLEMDMYEGKAFQDKVLIKKDVLEEADGLHSTGSACIQIDTKILRSACRNNMVTQSMFLSFDKHRRIVAFKTGLTLPLDDSYSTHSLNARSVEENKSWFLQILGGDFMKTNYEIIGQLLLHDVVKACGFL